MKKLKKRFSAVEGISRWIGSPQSLLAHTIVFFGAFSIALFGLAAWDTVLLAVTTVVSLEAIYLAIFIQMSVNRAEVSLAEVEEGVAEIEENIDDMSVDIEGIEKDVAEISEDIEGIEKDVAEIEENIDGVSENIEEMQGEIEDLSEEESKDDIRKKRQEVTLGAITTTLEKLLADIEALKERQ